MCQYCKGPIVLSGLTHTYTYLKECGLTNLEKRLLRRDQIEVFKILNGYENIDRNICSHSRKKDQCRLDIRKYLFPQRTFNEWKKLYTGCVTTSNVNMFKNKVDTYLRRADYIEV